MSGPVDSRDARDADQQLAEIHREFRVGLADRLEHLRAAFERLRAGYEAEAAEIFYRTAHSLKGTAPSFDAQELSEPAAALSALGRLWSEAAAVEAAELAAAAAALERLEAAIAAYTADPERRRG